MGRGARAGGDVGPRCPGDRRGDAASRWLRSGRRGAPPLSWHSRHHHDRRRDYRDRPSRTGGRVGAVATFMKPFDLAALHRRSGAWCLPPSRRPSKGAGPEPEERTGPTERRSATRSIASLRHHSGRGPAAGRGRRNGVDASRPAVDFPARSASPLARLPMSRATHSAAASGRRGTDHRTGGTVKISRIDVYRFRYTLAGGPLTLSGGRTVSAEDSTLVKVSTDEGLVGWGEGCPFSPTYMLAFRGRHAGRHPADGAGAAGGGPAADRAGLRADGRGPVRPCLRQVPHRHRLLGPPGPGDRPARERPPGRDLPGAIPHLPRRRGEPAGGDAGASRAASLRRASAASR